MTQIVIDVENYSGHRVQSVGWNRYHVNDDSLEASTGPILIGTSRGYIMECCIESGEDTKFFGGSVDQYLKQLFSLSKGDSKGKCRMFLHSFGDLSS